MRFEAWDVINKVLYDVAEISFYPDGTIDGLLRDKETGEIVLGRTYFNRHVMVDGIREEHVILLPVKKFQARDLDEDCLIPPELIAITGEGEIYTRDSKDEPWFKEVIPVEIKWVDYHASNTKA